MIFNDILKDETDSQKIRNMDLITKTAAADFSVNKVG